MLLIAVETFYHEGRLIRPNQKIEVSQNIANGLLSGGFVKPAVPTALNVAVDDKKKEESSSVSQVEEVLPKQTAKKSNNGKPKAPITDL